MRDEERQVEQELKTRQRSFIRELVPDWHLTRQQKLWTIRIGIMTVVLLVILTLISLPFDITLWEWVKLLIIPAVIAGGGVWFNRQQHQRELEIADQRAQDEALQEYLGAMSELMIDHHLRTAQSGEDASVESDHPVAVQSSEDVDDVRAVARARTLAVLLRLNGARSGSVLRFLYESGLITTSLGTSSSDRPILNLQGATLIKATLTNANLSKASLSGAFLQEADLSSANLRWANLSEAFLQKADLSKAFLQEADLHGTNLEEANLESVDLQRAHLEKVNLRQANLKFADLRGAALQGAILERADLLRAQFGEVHLEGALFDGANLGEANLKGTHLEGARFEGFYFDYGYGFISEDQKPDIRTDLTNAKLQGAHLRGAHLWTSILNGAELQGADLREADLGEANLKGALLEGAKLQGAILEDANLSEVKGLTGEQLETAAKSLKGATMPNGQKYEDWLKSKGQEEEG